MDQSTEARPGPKINLFARLVNVFKLKLLTIFPKSTVMDVWKALIAPLTCCKAGNELNVSQSMSR